MLGVKTLFAPMADAGEEESWKAGRKFAIWLLFVSVPCPAWYLIGPLHSGIAIALFTYCILRDENKLRLWKGDMDPVHQVIYVIAAICCFIMALAWAFPLIGHQHAALAVVGFMALLTCRQPQSQSGT